MLKKLFIVIVFILQFFLVCEAGELEVILLERESKVQILVSNISTEIVEVENMNVLMDCKFIGNFCLKARDQFGNEINVRYYVQNFDTSFKHRSKLRPSKVTGFSLTKDKLARMLDVEQPKFVYLKVYYHNKSLNKTFESRFTKIKIKGARGQE